MVIYNAVHGSCPFSLREDSQAYAMPAQQSLIDDTVSYFAAHRIPTASQREQRLKRDVHIFHASSLRLNYSGEASVLVKVPSLTLQHRLDPSFYATLFTKPRKSWTKSWRRPTLCPRKSLCVALNFFPTCRLSSGIFCYNIKQEISSHITSKDFAACFQIHGLTLISP
jgi:hypothetical protein